MKATGFDFAVYEKLKLDLNELADQAMRLPIPVCVVPRPAICKLSTSIACVQHAEDHEILAVSDGKGFMNLVVILQRGTRHALAQGLPCFPGPESNRSFDPLQQALEPHRLGMAGVGF